METDPSCQLWSPERCNCLVWALTQWWHFGGYILLRRSRHFWLIPHILWVAPYCGRVFSFVPTHPVQGLPALILCLWFEGTVLEGDPL